MVVGIKVRRVSSGGDDGGVDLHGGQYRDVGVPWE